MSLPRVLTAAALGLFFIGNLFVVREHSANDGAAAAGAATGATAEASSPPQALLAEATVRQLRREVATTNALLGRAPREWHDDAGATGTAGAAIGNQQLRGGSTVEVAKQAAELKVCVCVCLQVNGLVEE